MKVDDEIYLRVLKKSGYQCGYCGVFLDDKLSTVNLKTPRALGGDNDISNLVAACKPCDRLKAHKDVEEFRAFVYLKISSDIDKVFTTLDKIGYLCKGDVSEIEMMLSRAKIFLNSKVASRQLVFPFEVMEKTSGIKLDRNNPITVKSLQ